MQDQYSLCLCGSGKKFKWCCQPIHEELEQFFGLREAQQFDAALAKVDSVIAQHPTLAEPLGQKAALLFENDRPEDAEKTLDEAFKINPDYAFGYFLRGNFRLYENEVAGALILFRKAAQLYHPDTPILAQVYLSIFERELEVNHPVAARAALELALKNTTEGADDLRKGLRELFDTANNQLPECARKRYEYRPLAANAPAARKAAWKILEQGLGRLADVVLAFQFLVQQDDKDAAAWYNLGLTHAWLGHNLLAIQAIESYLLLEPDVEKAAQAWTLVEVLRLGVEALDQSDYLNHSYLIPVKQPQPLADHLIQLSQNGQLIGIQVDQERGTLVGTLLEAPPVSLVESTEPKMLRPAAHVLFTGSMLRLWNFSRELLDQALKSLREKIGPWTGEPFFSRFPAKFVDVLSEAIAYPKPAISQEDVRQRTTAYIQKFYEEKWLHKPLKSLGGVPPTDAAGHPQLRKKVIGLVRFIEQCAGLTGTIAFDFGRLLTRLRLDDLPPTPAAEEPAAPVDVTALSAADLAQLPAESLDDAQLESAFQTAKKLDAHELAAGFAKALVERPAVPGRPDRYVWFNHLINMSASAKNFDSAMDWVNQGESDDCSHNEGRRRNDYELRRGQVHVKRGEVDQAFDVFQRLAQRSPGELKFQVSAAEAMLSANQGARANALAQAGLDEAKKQNHRDFEGVFKELLEAAKSRS